MISLADIQSASQLINTLNHFTVSFYTTLRLIELFESMTVQNRIIVDQAAPQQLSDEGPFVCSLQRIIMSPLCDINFWCGSC